MDCERRVPQIDLDRELAVQQTCLKPLRPASAIGARLLRRWNLVWPWPILLASLNTAAIGAAVDLAAPCQPPRCSLANRFAHHCQLCPKLDRGDQEIASRRDCPFTILGETKDTRLRIDINSENVIDVSVLIWKCLARIAVQRTQARKPEHRQRVDQIQLSI